MQTTGIIRKIDELGRIVLPKELRKYLNINPGDDFQIAIESSPGTPPVPSHCNPWCEFG